MAKDFLYKKLAGCIVKGMRSAYRHKKRFGVLPEITPIYCAYATAGDKPGEEFCELTECKISEVETCPQDIKYHNLVDSEAPLFKNYSAPAPVKKIKKPRAEAGGITHIFIKSRNGYHIMKGSRRSYCRGIFEIMGRAFHFKNMPSSSLCAHCVNAYRQERNKIAHDIA